MRSVDFKRMDHSDCSGGTLTIFTVHMDKHIVQQVYMESSVNLI